MPKTKRRIVKQNNTRKNDKKGGAPPQKIAMQASPENKSWQWGRKTIEQGLRKGLHSISADATKKFIYPLELKKKYIKGFFNVTEGDPIDNYSKYKKYECEEEKPILIEKINKSSEPDNPCMQGVFTINGFIYNDIDKKLILTIKKSGYSAVFHSDHFNFKTQTEYTPPPSSNSSIKKKTKKSK